MSVVPFASTVVYAGQNGASSFHFSPEDCTAVIQGIPKSGNLDVFLPGPSDPVPPSEGDWYIIADPNGLLTPGDDSTKSLTVHGNGFPINLGTTLVITQTFGWAAFLFDPLNRLWITFVGNIA
jgi:hypothetical protein